MLCYLMKKGENNNSNENNPAETKPKLKRCV